MKLDFLQIGFQKCGTTFLEYNVYPKNENISCVPAVKDLELERCILNSLILPDGLEYDKEKFQQCFTKNCARLFEEGADSVNGIMFEPFTFLYGKQFDRKSVLD